MNLNDKRLSHPSKIAYAIATLAPATLQLDSFLASSAMNTPKKQTYNRSLYHSNTNFLCYISISSRAVSTPYTRDRALSDDFELPIYHFYALLQSTLVPLSHLNVLLFFLLSSMANKN